MITVAVMPVRFPDRRQGAQRPRRSHVSTPASTSTFGWCDIDGWDRLTGSARSHTHASPSSWPRPGRSAAAAPGSAIAFSDPAGTSASADAGIRPTTGDQAAKVFLSGMVGHYQGAIDTVNDEG